jgi:CRISPR-associated endonuclease/helicase Cas3
MKDDLRANEFSAFFHAVHGHKPFPWQERLAKRVFTAGWPEKALDVPTGGGKTATIDIAIYHLALDANQGPKRRAPVRILFVVDRRLIVDDAYTRAKTIAEKLAGATSGILERVARRLQTLAEDGKPPLVVARLRGGVPKEPDWVRTPAQPTVIVSTVDQVGSRLLFRGYGISDTMKSVHAGLLGADALLLLDEAHLSQPFVQTARDTRIFQDKGSWSADAASAPFQIVTLSATQSEKAEPFVAKDDYAHPVLGPRLTCAKPAELIKFGGEAKDEHFAHAFAEQAWALSKANVGTATVVAVVVNRVRRARQIFEKLKKLGACPLSRKALPDNDLFDGEAVADAIADLALLIGRTRELDRRELLNGLLPRISAQREQQESDRPLFIVATQCVEAGADLDFDALITEIAPLDCLRQRFGRLNRMGKRSDTRAVILAASDQIAKSAKPDPIYGDALKETWVFLNGTSKVSGKGKNAKRIIDFGVQASARWLPGRDKLVPYLAPRSDAPVLLPRDVTLWSRTTPVPAVDPEVSLYLHGPGRGRGDVEIVWRADLDGNNPQDWIDRVTVCPPSVLEAISVPIGEAKLWLKNEATGDVSDVEAGDNAEETSRAGGERLVLCWRGTNDARTGLVTAKDMRPGDMLIVRSRDGGCNRWGWAPEVREPVPDLGREANHENRGRDILRLTRASPELGLDALGERALVEQLAEMTDGEIVDLFSKHLVRADEGTAFRPSGRIRVVRGNNGDPLALEQSLRRWKGTSGVVSLGGDAVTEDDESSLAAQRPVMLDSHCQGVSSRARRFAEQAGLALALVEDITLAGFLHDGGKAHPAFKCLLYGGNELAAISGPPLAKSTKFPESRLEWIEACRRAGFQQGGRHEVASLAFAEAHPKLAGAHSPELVLWLIGTHHGHGRPFFPAKDWPGQSAKMIEADLGDGMVAATCARSMAALTAQWIDLFSRLEAQYGAWGLARLEAILRLADHRQSEAEEIEKVDSQSKKAAA